MLSAQFPKPYTLCLQCLLQLQDSYLQATEPTQHTALPMSPRDFPRDQSRGSLAAGGMRALTCVSISCFFSLMRDRPEKSMVSVIRRKRKLSKLSHQLWETPECAALASVLDLLLAGLGGGHHVSSPLVDRAGALLQAAQVGAVFVSFYLQGAQWAPSAGYRQPVRTPSPGLTQTPAQPLTFEAATSWAVLAAISCEQTMSSSYLPM